MSHSDSRENYYWPSVEEYILSVGGGELKCKTKITLSSKTISTLPNKKKKSIDVNNVIAKFSSKKTTKYISSITVLFRTFLR